MDFDQYVMIYDGCRKCFAGAVKVIDFPLKPSDLSRYDEVLYGWIYHGQVEGKPGSL